MTLVASKTAKIFTIFAFKVNGEDGNVEKKEEEEEKTSAMPRKAGNPITNKK